MVVGVEFSDELVEKVVAFIEREVGRDAPLTAEDEAMVRDLLAHDSDVQRLADEQRAVEAALLAVFGDVWDMEVDDELVALVEGWGPSRQGTAFTKLHGVPETRPSSMGDAPWCG